MIARQIIINSFKITKSFTITGKEVGLSRERVRQIVRKHGDEEAIFIADGLLHSDYAVACRDCKRIILTRRTKPRIFCNACDAYHKKWDNSLEKPTYQRPLMPYGSCPKCGIAFTGRKGNKTFWKTLKKYGICGKCYSQTAEYKLKQKESFRKHREERREYLNLYSRQYRLANKERVDGYHKKSREKWYPKNKEHYNEVSRRYYIRKMLGEI